METEIKLSITKEQAKALLMAISALWDSYESFDKSHPRREIEENACEMLGELRHTLIRKTILR